MRKNVSIEMIENLFKDREPKPVGRYKYFSVLLPLVEKDGKLHVFILTTTYIHFKIKMKS